MSPFARHLASSGFIVLTPELPDLSRYLITARSTDMIEDAALWFSNRSDLTRGHRIGLAGISFAGGLSMVAAGRPSLRGRLGFVFSFGGHANFQRVVRYLCSGTEPPAPGIDHAPPVPAPHDYGVAIVTLDLAEQLVPPEQVEPLKTGILTFLHASHLALFDQKTADQEFAHARAQEEAMAEPGRTFLHLVNVRDVRTWGRNSFRTLPISVTTRRCRPTSRRRPTPRSSCCTVSRTRWCRPSKRCDWRSTSSRTPRCTCC